MKSRKEVIHTRAFIDLTGKKFGRLTVIGLDTNNTCNEKKWLCSCECGGIKSVKGSSLRNGVTVSCGCYQREVVKKVNKIHGMYTSRIHRIWSAMKQRCYNPNNEAYKNYGGRGIKVCDEWKNDFTKFCSWALCNGYSDELSIDRIDNDGNYEPNNCRWATREQQNNNTRRQKNKLG